MNKLILIVLDGLNNRVAEENMGYMAHLVEEGIGVKTTLTASLPTLSRPLYETILTGKTPFEHGILNNNVSRKSKEVSLFHKVEAAGGTSAAAAYNWVSELYMKTPFNHKTDCYQLIGEGPIHHGIYYYEEMYPDAQLFDSTEFLIGSYNPDFVLIHPMNIDFVGHNQGCHSPEYSKQVRNSDRILSDHLQGWVEKGYRIIVTADHGMCEDGAHSGIHDDERLVPFWYVGEELSVMDLPATSTEIYRYVLKHMGIVE